MTRQVLAYLGYRGNSADDEVLKMISQAEEELVSICGPPKSVVGIWEYNLDFPIKSESLERYMEGAKYIGIFATTLGAGADMLIRRYEVSDMRRAVITDAVASTMVNDHCGTISSKRFSPGYGDFKLEYQADILKMLDTGKRIGLSLTDSFMLIPAKSVTGVYIHG